LKQNPNLHKEQIFMKTVMLLTGLMFICLLCQGQNSNVMEQRMTFMTLGVSDLNQSIDFYEHVFGWRRSDLSNENIIFYELNGIFLSLYDREELAKDATVDPSGDGFRGFTMAYNTRSEKEVDELVEKLRSQGVSVIKEPQKVFWGGYSSYIADPDGNLWEIAYNPFLKLD
jgi:catechol 2,3-dioxygenase-like lactoylglutathione lyase family enzyme